MHLCSSDTKCYSYVVMFIPFAQENVYYARLMALACSRLKTCMQVVVRLTTNLPEDVHKLVCEVNASTQLNWARASKSIKHFELNHEAEEDYTLLSERFISSFPFISVVFARYLVGYYDNNIDLFLKDDNFTQAHKDVLPDSVLQCIANVIQLDVNPARTKALRKRKLGLRASGTPQRGRKAQTTLSWKT